MNRTGVLFVSHDATRTGAPIALLRFLRWFKKNGNRPFAVLLPTSAQPAGELIPDFEEVAETWQIDRSRWCPGGTRATTLRLIGLNAWARRADVAEIHRFARRCAPALVYKNSISSAWADMLPREIPVLTHVHELEYAFRRQSPSHLARLIAETRHFIACSDAVRQNLVVKQGIPTERIETVHEPIDIAEMRAERTRQQVFEELRVPDGATLVIGGGAGNWRKGGDLFVQLARFLCRQRSDVYFVWIGGFGSDTDELEHDVRLTELTERVRLIGTVLKTSDYFAASDVFVLTSREDPYPLVCLEAAALEKPIVCFASGGGMPEFVESDCGFIVPYLDIAAMADRVTFLLNSPERRLGMGAAARRKVEHSHDIGVIGPRIMEIIEKTISRTVL